MKRMLCAFVAITLLFAAATASAAVVSKTTTDNTTVNNIVSVDNTVIEETFVVEIAQDEEEVVQEITNLYTFVVAEQKAPVEYFPVEVQEKVAEILPEEVKAETLECTEFVTVRELGYKETYGDVVVNFSFTTQYKAQQKVVVLMGFYTGEVDEAGNPIVEWMPIEATALEDGTLDVTMTQEMLVKFGEAKTVAMAVLSEQTELEAAPAVPAA